MCTIRHYEGRVRNLLVPFQKVAAHDGSGLAQVQLDTNYTDALDADARKYYWYSPRIIVASTAAAVSVTVVMVRTAIVLYRDFSWDFVYCILTLSFARGGIGGGCTELGKCGKSARYYLASVGVDGDLAYAIPLGFACEVGPGGASPAGDGLVKCGTAELVSQVTSGVLLACCLLAWSGILLMLYLMLTNHKQRLVQMRRGNWAGIPAAYQNMGTAVTLRSLLWFVASVWFYAVIGFYIYLVVLVLLSLASTFLAMCYGKWSPPAAGSNSSENELFLGEFGRDITRALERYLLKLSIETIIAYGGALLLIHAFLLDSWKSKGGHAVTRNHPLFFLIDYIFMSASIPIVIVRLSYRILGSVGLMFVFLSRVDVPVFVGGLEGMDPGYVTYVAALTNEHDTTHPVLVTFCRHLLLAAAERLGGVGMRAKVMDRSDDEEAAGAADPHEAGTAGSSGGSRGKKSRGFFTLHANNPDTENEYDDEYDDTSSSSRQNTLLTPTWGDGASSFFQSHRIKVRWALAVTLANNPQLIRLRKHHLQQDDDGVATKRKIAATIRNAASSLARNVRDSFRGQKVPVAEVVHA